MEKIRIRDPGWKEVGSGIRDKHPRPATLLISHQFEPVLRSHDILVRIRTRRSIRTSDQWIRILLFSSLTFKTPSKNKFVLKSFSAYYFFQGTPFFKDKKSKRSHKTVGIMILLTIFA
jgi:hypothetical protein